MENSKTLKTIQTIAKVLKIISLIAFIACWVIFGGCLFSIGGLALGMDKLVTKFNDFDLTTGQMYGNMIIAAILALSNTVPTWFTYKYLKHELAAGTPFTMEGSKEIFRLGIISLITMAITSAVCGLAYGIIHIGFDIDITTSTEISGSLTSCLICLLLSLIFKLGAENQPQQS